MSSFDVRRSMFDVQTRMTIDSSAEEVCARRNIQTWPMIYGRFSKVRAIDLDWLRATFTPL